MKLTIEQLKQIIKEELSEIYEPGEMVPPAPVTKVDSPSMKNIKDS